MTTTVCKVSVRIILVWTCDVLKLAPIKKYSDTGLTADFTLNPFQMFLFLNVGQIVLPFLGCKTPKHNMCVCITSISTPLHLHNHTIPEAPLVADADLDIVIGHLEALLATCF